MKITRLLASALVFLAMTIPSIAAQSTAGKKSKWEEGAFATSVEVLPINFSGHNPLAILGFLRRVHKPKSEFESDVDFAERAKILGDQTMYGNVKVSDTLAFVLKPDELTYDANLKILTVTNKRKPMRMGQRGLDRYDGYFFASTRTNSGSYTVENGFGARRTVIKYVERKKGISFANKRDWWAATALTVKINAGSELARRLKISESVSMVFIGHLVSPLFVSGSSHWLPDIDHLEDTVEHAEALIFEPDAVWTIDNSSGTILSKEYYLQSQH
jgi:hypothetical protein